MLGMMPPNKKMATQIINGVEEQSSAPETEMDVDPGIDAAMDRIISSMGTKDKRAMLSGMRSLFEMLMAEAEIAKSRGG